MSGRGFACDSSRRLTMAESRPRSAQVWSNENSPPVLPNTHL